MPETVKSAGAYQSYGEYFGALRNLAAEYGTMPVENVFSAWARASAETNPFIQNRRVKSINTMPGDYGKEAIVEMLKTPDANEKPLRQVDHGLEWTAYPFRKIRTTYQAINTYHYFHFPAYLEEKDAKSEDLWREGRLIDKFDRTLMPDAWARQIVGQAVQEGKVAYVPRWEIDKSHNQVGYAFMQQIPSDWWKIVGFNSESKYTIMFNMVYFLQPGADWRQFGDLFLPYLEDFSSVLIPGAATAPKKGNGKKFVYASRGVRGADGRYWNFDMEKFSELGTDENGNAREIPGNPMLYNQNGVWAYWVTLPIEKAWVFEWDDTTRTVAPPLAGLFLAFDQLSALEDVALAILQNPLVQICLGEIPYWNEKRDDTSDQYKMSPTSREFFTALWYQMLQAGNAGGIGMYFAPAEHLHMESLAEAPNATKITSSGYEYAVQKSGMSGLIPINSDPRAGAVNLSATIEENAVFPIYRQMERMMESIYRQIGTKYEWRFEMFGGFLSDQTDIKTVQDGMSKGILSETMRYYALRGISLWDDMSISRLIKESGVMDMRLPLVSSYNMKQDTSGLPPQPEDKGGRPEKSAEDVASGNVGESYEGDADSMR